MALDNETVAGPESVRVKVEVLDDSLIITSPLALTIKVLAELVSVYSVPSGKNPEVEVSRVVLVLILNLSLIHI